MDIQSGGAPARSKLAIAEIETRHVALEGFCSINGGPDMPCTTAKLSLDGLVVHSTADASFADDAMLVLPHIGLLKAIVSRVYPGGFDLRFEPDVHSKLGTYLGWLNGVRDGDAHEKRIYQRFVPLKKLVSLEREGEPSSMARIIEVSRSGVGFTTSKVLTEGERVRVGTHAGLVVRVFEGGAAVHFDAPILDPQFDVMVDLNAAPAP